MYRTNKIYQNIRVTAGGILWALQVKTLLHKKCSAVGKWKEKFRKFGSCLYVYVYGVQLWICNKQQLSDWVLNVSTALGRVALPPGYSKRKNLLQIFGRVLTLSCPKMIFLPEKFKYSLNNWMRKKVLELYVTRRGESRSQGLFNLNDWQDRG